MIRLIVPETGSSQAAQSPTLCWKICTSHFTVCIPLLHCPVQDCTALENNPAVQIMHYAVCRVSNVSEESTRRVVKGKAPLP